MLCQFSAYMSVCVKVAVTRCKSRVKARQRRTFTFILLLSLATTLKITEGLRLVLLFVRYVNNA